MKANLKGSRIVSVVLLGLLTVASPIVWARSGAKNSDMGAQSASDVKRPEARIEREVGHELRLLPFFTVFDNLEFRVNGGQVELMGQVVSSALKQDAETAVKHIEGVESVINNIEVLPPSPADDAIRRAEYRAIYGQPGLDRYSLQAVPPIHIIVKGGHVTLVGVVADQGDKNLANIRANTVSGVFSVTNSLRAEK
jgi:hyperosmotically inducible protein